MAVISADELARIIQHGGGNDICPVRAALAPCCRRERPVAVEEAATRLPCPSKSSRVLEFVVRAGPRARLAGAELRRARNIPSEMLNATLRADFPRWGGRMLLMTGDHPQP